MRSDQELDNYTDRGTGFKYLKVCVESQMMPNLVDTDEKIQDGRCLTLAPHDEGEHPATLQEHQVILDFAVSYNSTLAHSFSLTDI